jgi:hypothetical protein
MKLILASVLSTILMLPAFAQNQGSNNMGQNGGNHRSVAPCWDRPSVSYDRCRCIGL